MFLLIFTYLNCSNWLYAKKLIFLSLVFPKFLLLHDKCFYMFKIRIFYVSTNQLPCNHSSKIVICSTISNIEQLNLVIFRPSRIYVIANGRLTKINKWRDLTKITQPLDHSPSYSQGWQPLGSSHNCHRWDSSLNTCKDSWMLGANQSKTQVFQCFQMIDAPRITMEWLKPFLCDFWTFFSKILATIQKE